MSCWNHSGLKVRHGRFSLTKRILITGGFGFIGGRLAVHLAQAGHQIVLGSRKVISPPTWLQHAEVTQIEWDDSRALELSCNGVDVVIQAAGMNVQDCAADPVAALEFNGLATARLVAAASRVGVKRFIYLSTAHVYASPLVGTITEETCPRNLHPYATSHLAGEHAVLSASQRGQIEGIVLRLSNAFGAPAHKDVNCWMLLVNDLCRQALQTNKMVLHSSGSQLRDFISMEYVYRVIEKLSSRGADTLPTNILNVGSGVSQSVLEMARLTQHRCKLFLGIEPELSYQEKGTNEKPEVLEFRPTRLEKMGIVVDLYNEVEIDRLLAFCQVSFDPSQSKKA
jgi:UDP-glucose 4-epimerase